MKLLKQSHLQAFNFQSATPSSHGMVKDSMQSFITHAKSKLHKKYPKIEKYTEVHVHSVLSASSSKKQKGGRISLPIDYFGVPGSTKMTTELSDSVLVSNDQYLRPELEQTFEPILTKEGGGHKFNVSKVSFKEALEKQKLNVTQRGLEALKHSYEKKFNKVLEKVSKKYKKEEVLHESMLQSVLKQREFNALRS